MTVTRPKGTVTEDSETLLQPHVVAKEGPDNQTGLTLLWNWNSPIESTADFARAWVAELDAATIISNGCQNPPADKIAGRLDLPHLLRLALQ